jgi:hypothetical protein
MPAPMIAIEGLLVLIPFPYPRKIWRINRPMLPWIKPPTPYRPGRCDVGTPTLLGITKASPNAIHPDDSTKLYGKEGSGVLLSIQCDK